LIGTHSSRSGSESFILYNIILRNLRGYITKIN